MCLNIVLSFEIWHQNGVHCSSSYSFFTVVAKNKATRTLEYQVGPNPLQISFTLLGPKFITNIFQLQVRSELLAVTCIIPLVVILNPDALSNLNDLG